MLSDLGPVRLPFTYGFMMDGEMVEKLVIPADTLIARGGKKSVDYPSSIRIRAGDLLGVALYKAEDASGGQRHWRVGHYEFAPVAASGRGTAVMPSIEVDSHGICTLIVDDQIAITKLELRFKDGQHYSLDSAPDTMKLISSDEIKQLRISDPERHPLRTIAEAAIETLASEVPEDLLVPRFEEPSGVIDVLEEFRSLPGDLLRAVGVGHGAFGQERLRAVGQSEVAKPRGGTTGLSQFRRRLHVIDAEIGGLQKESHDAPDTMRNWGKVESQLLHVDLAARRIQDSLTEMGTLSSRGWLWQRTGRSGQLREIRRTITQLVQELTVVPA